MGAEERQKTARKSTDTPRRRSRRPQDRCQVSEYDSYKQEVNKLWTSWVTASSTSDLWRRIEHTGLDNALKKLSECSISPASVSSDDSVNISAVMNEFGELLNCIRLAFINNETEIYDKDERELRNLTVSAPSIVEIWAAYSRFAANFAVDFVQKSWHNSSENRELLSTTLEVAASSVKLLVLTVNMSDYHSLDHADVLQKAALEHSESASQDLESLIVKVSQFGSEHSALDSLMELVGWLLYGMSHVTNKVIKVGLEARPPDSDVSDHEATSKRIESLLAQLQSIWGGDVQKPASPAPAPAPPEKKSSIKKSKNSKDNNASKEVKTEQSPVPDDNKRKKNGYLEVLQKLMTAYQKFSDDAWTAKRLPALRGSAGVELKYRMESYDNIGKLTVDACAMTKRKSMLESLGFTDDHLLHSDLFSIGPEALNCPQEVTISFPLITTETIHGSEIVLKVRYNGTWQDMENPETIDKGGQTRIVFRTMTCDAFTAVSYFSGDALMVGPAGANYVNEDNGKVEVMVPPDCFQAETTLGIKTIDFKKGDYSKMFVGIVQASVAVDITPESEGADMRKPITIQVPIKDDDDDRDTELVVVRCNDTCTQVLDPRQMAIKTVDRDVFQVDMKGFWCVAIVRIRRIFLNMRESIKKEFLVGYGKKIPCNILTFIDDVTRGEESQTFVMEVIEKRHVDVDTEAKRQVGLIEVKKSRSKDVLMKRGQQVGMVIDGQMRSTEALADGQNTLCFLQGGANVISIATEIKRDPEKLPDAMLFYKQIDSDTVMHSLAIMTRDLAELPTEDISAKTGLNVKISENNKEKEKEESAVQILKMESLMSLARELTFDEGSSLGRQLGVKADKIKQITELSEKDPVAANFEILCHWRGRFAWSAMADFLVSSLKAVGQMNYAELVTEVRKTNRGLEKTDFDRRRAYKS